MKKGFRIIAYISIFFLIMGFLPHLLQAQIDTELLSRVRFKEPIPRLEGILMYCIHHSHFHGTFRIYQKDILQRGWKIFVTYRNKEVEAKINVHGTYDTPITKIRLRPHTKFIVKFFPPREVLDTLPIVETNQFTRNAFHITAIAKLARFNRITSPREEHLFNLNGFVPVVIRWQRAADVGLTVEDTSIDSPAESIIYINCVLGESMTIPKSELKYDKRYMVSTFMYPQPFVFNFYFARDSNLQLVEKDIVYFNTEPKTRTPSQPE